MKFKHLLIVALMLAIFTIGAVSASDDIISDDNLAVEDGIDDSVVSVDENQESQIIQSADGENALGDYNEEDYDVTIYDEASLVYNNNEDFDCIVEFRSYDKTMTGDLQVFVNNNLKYTKRIASTDYHTYEDVEGDYDEFVLDVTTKNLEIASAGSYAIKVTFNNQVLKEGNVQIKLIPNLKSPNKMSIGEKESIEIYTPDSGAVVLKLYTWDDAKDTYVDYATQNIAVTNGHGSYSLSSLPQGDYAMELEFKYGNYGFFNNDLLVVKNSPGFSSTITPTSIIVGGNVNVNVVTPKLNGKIYIYVDNKELKSVSMINGQINEVISGLAVGTHKINVYYDNDDTFYSITEIVTVNPVPVKKDTVKLTLKKVAVKKSAKKLVLQATLKINGKAVKGKVIKFKFNKKTIKAKTNKKGVAKATVKKAVLKKLKIGKKLTYTATYSKTTKKVTVKVKK